MSNLYNVLNQLCEKKGITGYRLCKDLGIQPSLMTDLKMGRKSSIKAETANKIASYFQVSVGYLLGEADDSTPPVTKEKKELSDEDIMFALGDGLEKMTEAQFNEVKKYARFIMERDGNDK